MGANLGDMVIRIVGDTTGLDKSLTSSQKQMAAFGVNALAVIAVVAKIGKVVIDAAQKFADYGSAIYDASQKTGLSTDAIQEWKFIAEQTGGTLENVTGSVAMMTRGLATNAEAFAKLGIQTKNVDGSFRTTTEIFNDTIKTLSAMTNETERDQMAFKLLGRSAQTLIPILNAGADGIEGMKDEARALGIVLSKETISRADQLGDSIDALKAAGAAYAASVTDIMAPALIALNNGLKNVIRSWNDSASAQKNATDFAAGQASIEQIKSLIRETEKMIALNEESEGLASVTNDLIKEKQVYIDSLAIAEKKLSDIEAARLKTQADSARSEAAQVADEKKLAAIRAESEALLEKQRQEEAYNAFLDKQVEDSITRTQVLFDLFSSETDAKETADQAQIDSDTEKTDALIANAQEYAATYIPLIDGINQVTKSIFEQLGTDLANNELSWKSLGTAAINSIGAIVSAIGDELSAKGAAAFVEAIAASLNPFTAWAAPGIFASAGALSAGAVAAWASGAFLKNIKLAEGGIVQPQPGGVQATIAEAGMAEAVIPLDRLDSMLSSRGNGGSDSGMMSLTVQMDSKVLYSKLFDATKNRTVLVSAGAVV